MSRKIRILFITVGLEIGGTEKMIVRILRNINKHRYDVSLCCLEKKGPLHHEIERGKIDVLYLNIPKRPLLYSLLLHFVAVVRLFLILRKKRFKIVHSFLPRANIISRIAGYMAGVPIVISSNRTSRIRKKYYLFLDWLTSPLVDKITAVSNAVGRYTIKKMKMKRDKIAVIENGIDFKNLEIEHYRKEDWGINSNTDVIGIVGRLVPVKGHKCFLRAAQIIKRESPHVKFFIVGDGPERERLKQMVRDLDLIDNIVFTGMVQNIFKFIKIFDILVSCSLWEGMSNSILEAMAMGKPVVATQVGGTPEIVIDGVNGFLVPSKDACLLASKVLILLRDRELCQRMGESGKIIVKERFDIKHTIRKMEDMYNNLLIEKGVSVK